MATRDGNAGDLERSIAVLWGEHAPRRRGPKGTLTAQKIIHAAIRLADTEGLGAVSMQRVAGELGFTTMSLYNHIPSKELLLEAMMDVAAGEPPDLAQDTDWREGVLAWARALWASFEAHPWTLRIPVGNAPRGPHQLAWFDRLLTRFLQAGLSPQQARAAGLYVLTSVRGLAEVSLDLTSHDPGGQAEAELAHLLSQVADPARFPGLAQVFTANPAASRDDTGNADALNETLAFGLARLLDGIEAWTARRA
jgi:AcrR family transcriptional regulator